MRAITFSQVKPVGTVSFLGNGRLTGGEELTITPAKSGGNEGRSVISPILLIIAAIVLFFMIKAR